MALREWIGTVSSWPPNFQYKDMAEVGFDLSQRLRDPNGEHKCDIVIALTHARYVFLYMVVLYAYRRRSEFPMYFMHPL